MPGFRVEQTRTWFVTCASEQALRGFLIEHDVDSLGPEGDSEIDVHHERAATTAIDLDKLITETQTRRPRPQRSATSPTTSAISRSRH